MILYITLSKNKYWTGNQKPRWDGKHLYSVEYKEIYTTIL